MTRIGVRNIQAGQPAQGERGEREGELAFGGEQSTAAWSKKKNMQYPEQGSATRSGSALGVDLSGDR